MSKKRNERNAKTKGTTPGGAIKLATRKPTISSMTITAGSRSPKIVDTLLDSHIAQKIIATKVKRAIGKEAAAIAFKPNENGIATTVPAVPGSHGRYPTPKPVAKNSNTRGEIRLKRMGCLSK
jgi:hypothetical protein